MSAEALGTRLADEVKEESLATVLSSLRVLSQSQIQQDASPATGNFGIPALDALRRSTKTTSANLPAAHLQGPTSSGKTSLSYYLISIITLPGSLPSPRSVPNSPSISLHGCSSAVIVLDTDGRFSALRLQQVMRSYVTQRIEAALSSRRSARPAQPPVEPGSKLATPDSSSHPSVSSFSDTISDVVKASLKHIHILRPTSTASLQTTIQTSLPDYLMHAQHPSQHRPVGAIILDSADAFTWQDRLDSTSHDTKSSSSSSSSTNTRSALQSLQRLLSCPLLLLCWTGNAFSSPALRADDLLIRLERIHVPKFGPGMSVEEAERDRAQREEVVRRGVFAGKVSFWEGRGSSGGSGANDTFAAARDGRRRESSFSSSSFRFWIKSEGVGILHQH